jgi:hypothetical protein
MPDLSHDEITVLKYLELMRRGKDYNAARKAVYDKHLMCWRSDGAWITPAGRKALEEKGNG